MTSPVKVLLVDDDALVRTGLRLMFGGASGIEIVGEIGDGRDVLDTVARLRPDVVLMDIRMPHVDGIAATRALSARDTETPRVIVLTTFDADGTVVEALRAGAAGFLLKHSKPEQIVAAVHAAAAGEPVLSAEVTRTLIARVAGDGADRNRRGRARERLAVLSDKERDVARAVAKGLSNSEIGQSLYLSSGTVKAYVSSALSKLDLTNRIQLALLAHDAEL
ncbi:two component transcriptional regulator, LuxR family [Stackebrandtia nassauensis DSM 44728]|uniref:Two component transcriptional regulator, LuxR family n=1 Tax=Stackebrandtia nassauensis (strain DSM 44728 / CIP 108903 / NRRL B-16338 / NBRC 102104 / LLR-40K-21) TaxID=446470 RepID=D3QAQ8_STANL|nr:response regulator transcription factor [Stackebrandtia nassauensis]ADD44704.1 two component transcriptional regulator, LuxR family [Stackebrandtia nassauensis DSM 44728]